jgi:peptidoglycan-associated lipoprotein
MRQWAFVLALAGAVAFGGCNHKPPAAPPPPPAPAAPATPPPAPPPAAPAVTPQVDEYARIKGMSSDEIERLGLFAEIHFDFDRHDIREVDRPLLTKSAEVLKKFDFIKITVEGHCDERGTVEYNLALGEKRARAVADYLLSLGVLPERLKTVSYGKEVQVCQDANEECWFRNRRARLTVTGKIVK